jgi:hypothetical protein
LGHQISTFWPDDTADTMYVAACGMSLEDILARAQEKWPGIQASELTVTAEHIQTDCLDYDEYDPMDYTNFICLTADQSYFQRMQESETP